MVLSEAILGIQAQKSKGVIAKLPYLPQWKLATIGVNRLEPKHIAECLPLPNGIIPSGETEYFVPGGRKESLENISRLIKEDMRVKKMVEVAKTGSSYTTRIENNHGSDMRGVIISNNRGKEFAFVNKDSGTFHILTNISLSVIRRKEGYPSRRDHYDSDEEREYHRRLVEEYTVKLQISEPPPVFVYGPMHQGQPYTLYDGHHRAESHDRLGRTVIYSLVKLMDATGSNISIKIGYDEVEKNVDRAQRFLDLI